jgi:hypothetical protein
LPLPYRFPLSSVESGHWCIWLKITVDNFKIII